MSFSVSSFLASEVTPAGLETGATTLILSFVASIGVVFSVMLVRKIKPMTLK